MRRVLSRGDSRFARESDSAFIVESGWIAEYVMNSEGRRQIVYFRVPGDLIGLEALFQMPSFQEAICLTNSVVSVVPRSEFSHELNTNPQVLRMALIYEIGEIAIRGKSQFNLGRRKAEERLAHLFSELSFRTQVRGECARMQSTLPLRQIDIADAVGLTPVHVSRTLSRLSRAGAIVPTRNGVAIRDEKLLHRISEFDPSYLTIGLSVDWRTIGHWSDGPQATEP